MKYKIFIAVSVFLSAFAFGNLNLQQVSSDPYTNTTSQHKTEVEPDTFSNGSTIVSAYQVGRFFDGGASNIGWSTSTDGGKTWTHGFLEGITKFASGTHDRVSDASVAYDAAHKTWIISSLPLNETPSLAGVGVVVNLSTDGGLTWGKAIDVTVASNNNFLDKNWTACDNTPSSPFYGHCYTEFDNASAFDTILMSTSTDGGVTWSIPVSPSGSPSGLGGQPVIQPNGTVIVPHGDGNISNINSFNSTDGGNSWSGVSLVSATSTHENTGGLRTEPLPTAEIDKDGTVYVAWQDCRFESACSANDIVLSSSKDGLTWTEPVRIPLDAVGSGVDHFIPGLGVDPSTSGDTAHLALTYYYYPKSDCTADICEMFVGSSHSNDSGKTWTAPVQVAGPMKIAAIPKTSQGSMVGDYISTSFVDGKGLSVFAAVTSTGEVAMHSPASAQFDDTNISFKKSSLKGKALRKVTKDQTFDVSRVRALRSAKPMMRFY